jgi:hypothetical protein
MKLNRPSPAMLVAVAALVVSLGGTATAASVLITSSAQIGSGAITGGDIRNGTIKRRDLDARLRKQRGARGLPGPAGPQGPAGAAGVAGAGGVSVSSVATDIQTSNAAAWDNIPELKQTITIPADRPYRVLATLSGESECSGGDANANFCSMRVAIDGQVLTPDTNKFGFNSTNAGNELEGRSWKALSFQRLSPVLSPGQHTVTVQHRVVLTGAGAVTHHLDEAVLSLQQFSP